MRQRSAALTDVAVLVVDGKDGVKPQTKECVAALLREAVATVVAVTKSDTLSDEEEAKQSISNQLLELGLVTELAGGEVPIVAVSARTGAGLQDLKETLALQAELLDLRARRDVPGEASIVDAASLKGSGVVVDAIVRWGELKVGDYVVADLEFGRVKALQTDAVAAETLLGVPQSADKAVVSVQRMVPGVPVRILGLKGVPLSGQSLFVVPDEEKAKRVVEGRKRRAAARALAQVAAADAIKRAAERQEYMARRTRVAAMEAAKARERQRYQLTKAGQPVPPELAMQPWEVLILKETTQSNIIGVTSDGKKVRVQGDQQTAPSMNFLQASLAASAKGEQGKQEQTETETPAGPKVVPFIVKTDSAGSIVSVESAFERIVAANQLVYPKIVSVAVGEVSPQEVDIAADTGGHIVCFGAKVPNAIAKLAERKKVRIISGRVIYHILDEVCELLAEFLPPSDEEVVTSIAEVKAVFNLGNKKSAASSSDGSSASSTGSKIAGCVIIEGNFKKSDIDFYRVTRNEVIIKDCPSLESLMHVKEKIEIAKKGQECGMSLTGFQDYEVGDKISAITRKKVKAKLQVRFD
jgi:translation initiation factor IF-2